MKKILFIEDEQALQKALGDVLKKEKFKLINALDGEIGLRLAKKEKPDLIVLDVILPKINGLEVLEELKKDTETQKIPVIILTNNERMEDVDKALAYGATIYLIKTQYSLSDLIGKIKKTLNSQE